MEEHEFYFLIHRALELPDTYQLKPETKIAEVPWWDSLGWVSVITAIENAYDFELDINAIDRFVTIGDLVTFVNKSNLCSQNIFQSESRQTFL